MKASKITSLDSVSSSESLRPNEHVDHRTHRMDAVQKPWHLLAHWKKQTAILASRGIVKNVVENYNDKEGRQLSGVSLDGRRAPRPVYEGLRDCLGQCGVFSPNMGFACMR